MSFLLKLAFFTKNGNTQKQNFTTLLKAKKNKTGCPFNSGSNQNWKGKDCV